MTATSFSISTTDEDVASRSAQTEFRFDALEPKGRRKTPQQTIQREDVYLKGGKRTKLQANANDIVRNFTIAAWAVRRHLDYVARFDFQASTGDEGLDRDLEHLMKVQSRPYNFDRGRRFTREKGFRLMEARRVVDQDAFMVLLNTGEIQGIEADLVKDPDKPRNTKAHEWVDGILIDQAGQAKRYQVHRREKGRGYKPSRQVTASNMIHYGFFERWATEQVRGVSPIVAALNNFRDVYENIDYALMKSKISQIFAFALKRPMAENGLDAEFLTEGSDGDDLPDETVPPQRDIDLSNGPTLIDLQEGEDASVIESKTPSSELQQFSRLVVMIALKCLDIPYSFFDEAHTNYSGARGSWLHYERSCLDKRDDQLEMRRVWTVFQLRRWILSGELKLPGRMALSDLNWSWIPKGMPWWKPSEELVADLMAIQAGLTSPQKVAAKNDLGDVKDNIAQTAEVVKYAEEKGFNLVFNNGLLFPTVNEGMQPQQ